MYNMITHYIYIYIYIHTYVHTYIYIYIHTHTCLYVRPLGGQEGLVDVGPVPPDGVLGRVELAGLVLPVLCRI